MAVASDIGSIWSSAVQDYEKITGFRLEQQLLAAKADGAISDHNNNTKIEDILLLITTADSRFRRHRHDGSKVDRFRSLVRDSLTPIAKLSSVVAHATKATFPPSEALFAAVQALITTANTVSADYDRVVGFFEDLEAYLRQLRVLEGRVPEDVPEVERVLTEVFTAVLALCGIVTKYLQTNRIVKAFKSLVSGEDAELKSAHERFHKAVQRERDVVRNATLAGVDQLRVDARSAHEGVKQSLGRIQQDLKDQETAEKREAMLSWLSDLDFHDKQRATYSKRHQGTGQWLLDSDTFQTWFREDEPSTLWCPGIPGAGKTVMVSTAVCYVEEHTETSQVAIAYVYCDYKDPKTRSENEILASLARQLAEQCKPLPSELVAFCEKYMGRRNLPDQDERVALLQDLTRYFDKTYVFIDAMDECMEENRERLLDLVRDLEASLRLFITARPHIDLEGRFSNLSRIDVVARDDDVQAYLSSVIDTNRRMRLFAARDSNLKTDITKSLHMKADGMFLLAHLQILHLCGQSSAKNVRKSLDTLSGGLFSFYDGAMGRIAQQDESDRKLARKALSYIFCAERPLSRDELLHALSIEPGDTELDGTSIAEAQILLSVTGGLIRVDESGSAGFVHYTVQQYLEKHPEELLPQPEVEMAKTCLRYLSLDEFKLGRCPNERSLLMRMHIYSFYCYAADYCMRYTRSLQDEDGTNLIYEFLTHPGLRLAFLQVQSRPFVNIIGWHERHRDNVTALHLAAFWGLDKVVAKLCEVGFDINSQDSDNATALHFAAEFGYSSVVPLLLAGGARTDLTDNNGDTAMVRACKGGHIDMVELLYQHAKDTVLRWEYERTKSLFWAIRRGHREVVQALLGYCADLGMAEAARARAFNIAVGSGEDGLVQMLLDEGADVNAGSGDWGCINCALIQGHESTAHLLLEHGAIVSQPDSDGNVPLHWAVPYPNLLKLMLEKGAQVDAQNSAGETPLHWASRQGRAAAIAHLLQFHASVDTLSQDGITVLQIAAVTGDEEIVRLLLDAGADPLYNSAKGSSPLHIALIKKHFGVAKLLADKADGGDEMLETIRQRFEDEALRTAWESMADTISYSRFRIATTGLRSLVGAGNTDAVREYLDHHDEVDIDEIDPNGGCTALTLAAQQGMDQIVQTLLEYGADPNKRDQYGNTPLHLAIGSCSKDIVETLVYNGADPEAKFYGETPLFISARDNSLAIMDILTAVGADARATAPCGMTALHWAARNGIGYMVHKLLKRGADLNAMDRWGRTPLIFAIERGRRILTTWFLESGADPALLLRDGSTALHMAAYVGDERITGHLLSLGVGVNIKARGGLTALHVAALMGHRRIAELLLARGAEGSEGMFWCIEECAGDELEDIFAEKSLCSRLAGLLKKHRGIVDHVGASSRGFSVQQLTDIGKRIILEEQFALEASIAEEMTAEQRMPRQRRRSL